LTRKNFHFHCSSYTQTFAQINVFLIHNGLRRSEQGAHRGSSMSVRASTPPIVLYPIAFIRILLHPASTGLRHLDAIR